MVPLSDKHKVNARAPIFHEKRDLIQLDFLNVVSGHLPFKYAKLELKKYRIDQDGEGPEINNIEKEEAGKTKDNDIEGVPVRKCIR